MARVLLTWIGITDLKAAGVRTARGDDPGVGPIAQAVEDREFDEIVLLWDRENDEGERFVPWLARRTRAKVTLRAAPLAVPTDYVGIYAQAGEALTWIRESIGSDAQISVHLSPGTTPMGVVWMLIGTTEGLELLQSSREAGVQTVKVPFEIITRFLPSVAKQLDSDLAELAMGLPTDDSFVELLGDSDAMKRLIAMANSVARVPAPVLIEGESGTGKEKLARAIHKASGRAGKFVAVNCGAIPKELVESEFFGHKRGAFTGANAERQGHFEHADGGTLFLDEIGELPLDIQVKLLRALQEQVIVRVGDSDEREVDLRVVAATNRDLVEEVSAGRFREDLYYRLAVFVLNVPPLRDRQGDITLLARRLLDLQQQKLGRALEDRKKVSADAEKVLRAHAWPGNVRELEATLLRALVWSKDATISAAEMRRALGKSAKRDGQPILGRAIGGNFSVEAVMDEVARHYIVRALEQAKGNKTNAARLVGLKSQQVFTGWMKRTGVKG